MESKRTTYYCCRGVQCPLYERCVEFSDCKGYGCTLRDTCTRAKTACRWCPLFCRDRPGAMDTVLKMLNEYDALQHTPVVNTVPPPPNMPIFIPTMMHPLRRAERLHGLPGVAMTVWRLFRRERSWAMDMKGWVGVAPSTPLIMSFYSKDVVLEYFWRRKTTRTPQLTQNPSIDILISPDYSLYDDEPAFINVYEWLRGELAYAYMATTQKPLAYDLRWITGDHRLLNKGIAFVNEHCLPLIAINMCINGDTPERWARLRDDLILVADAIPATTHVIFWGLNSTRRVKFVAAHFPKFTIVHGRAAVLAARRRNVDEEEMPGADVADLFLANVRHYTERYTRIKESESHDY